MSFVARGTLVSSAMALAAPSRERKSVLHAPSSRLKVFRQNFGLGPPSPSSKRHPNGNFLTAHRRATAACWQRWHTQSERRIRPLSAAKIQEWVRNEWHALRPVTFLWARDSGYGRICDEFTLRRTGTPSALFWFCKLRSQNQSNKKSFRQDACVIGLSPLAGLAHMSVRPTAGALVVEVAMAGALVFGSPRGGSGSLCGRARKVLGIS